MNHNELKDKIYGVIESNKGKYYTIRIRNIDDLMLVSEIAQMLGYLNSYRGGKALVSKYKKLVEKSDTQFFCFYENIKYMVHNHDCQVDCLLDLTKSEGV